jgi:glycine cleavage system H protein
MVVILMLLTVLAFVAFDVLVVSRRRNVSLLREGDAIAASLEETEPDWVSGYRLPDALLYHPGHLWVRPTGGDEAFVGIDDFARRLLGKDLKLNLPRTGSRVQAGHRAVRVHRNGHSGWLLSPLAGEVTGINPRLKEEPDLMYREPYGRGWLFKLRVPQLARETANLLGGSLARRWTEDTRDRFQRRLVFATGSVIQDGGDPVPDISSKLGDAFWTRLVDEFLTLDHE